MRTKVALDSAPPDPAWGQCLEVQSCQETQPCLRRPQAAALAAATVIRRKAPMDKEEPGANSRTRISPSLNPLVCSLPWSTLHHNIIILIIVVYCIVFPSIFKAIFFYFLSIDYFEVDSFFLANFWLLFSCLHIFVGFLCLTKYL